MSSLPNHPTERARGHAGTLALRLIERTLGGIAALLLLALVLVTCIDVVGRYFLDAPLAGAFEITELLLAALVFTALPLATERRDHVEVDMVGHLMGERIDRAMVAFGGLFTAAVLATFSWRLFTHAMKAAADGSVTNVLKIPLAPFGFLAAAACLISTVIAVLRGFRMPDHAAAGESQGPDSEVAT